RTAGIGFRNKFGAMLKGILKCGPCGCAMTPGHWCKDGRRYRYYCCTKSQRHGKDACPSRRVSATPIEDFVVAQIRRVGKNPALLQETLAEARRQADARLKELDVEGRRLQRELAHLQAEARNGPRLAELRDGVARIDGRIAQVEDQAAAL